jgi:hypothetical protein
MGATLCRKHPNNSVALVPKYPALPTVECGYCPACGRTRTGPDRARMTLVEALPSSHGRLPPNFTQE